MIKLTFTKDTLPAELKSVAGEADNDGNFTIEVVDSKTHLELVENVKTLTEKSTQASDSDEKLTSLLGETPFDDFKSELKDLRDIAQQVEDGKLKVSTEITEQVETRVNAVTENFQKQIQVLMANGEELKAELGDKDKTIASAKLENAFLEAQTKLPDGIKIKDGYSSYIRDDVRRDFRVDKDGVIRGYEVNPVTRTESPLIDPANGAPLDMSQYILKAYETKPEMFEKPVGGAVGAPDTALPSGLTQEEFDSLTPLEKMDLAGTMAR